MRLKWEVCLSLLLAVTKTFCKVNIFKGRMSVKTLCFMDRVPLISDSWKGGQGGGVIV